MFNSSQKMKTIRNSWRCSRYFVSIQREKVCFIPLSLMDAYAYSESYRWRLWMYICVCQSFRSPVQLSVYEMNAYSFLSNNSKKK